MQDSEAELDARFRELDNKLKNFNNRAKVADSPLITFFEKYEMRILFTTVSIGIVLMFASVF